MPAMASVVLTGVTSLDGSTTTVTFGGRSPAGATEPARWSANPLGGINRLADSKLAFRIKRNSADTADQIKIDMVVPLPCLSDDTGTACSQKITEKAVVSFYAVMPDAFPDNYRATVISLIQKAIACGQFETAMNDGSNFY